MSARNAAESARFIPIPSSTAVLASMGWHGSIEARQKSHRQRILSMPFGLINDANRHRSLEVFEDSRAHATPLVEVRA